MKTFKILVLIVLSTLYIAVGCKKSDETKKDGLSQEIHNLVPDSIINNIKKLGMTINEGTTPPDLQKIYFAEPFILKASNRPGDSPGYTFSPYLVKFYDQNNDSLSIKLDYINGPESGEGLGGFISGKGNSFSIFAKVRSTYLGENADMVHVISGTIVSGAIKNLYFANFMINNYGNPGNIWIEIGQGRIIYDSDGTSEEQSSYVVPNYKKKSAISLKSISAK